MGRYGILTPRISVFGMLLLGTVILSARVAGAQSAPEAQPIPTEPSAPSLAGFSQTPGDMALEGRFRPLQRLFASAPASRDHERAGRRSRLERIRQCLGCSAWAVWNEHTETTRTLLLGAAALDPQDSALGSNRSEDQWERLARQELTHLEEVTGTANCDLLYVGFRSFGRLRSVQFQQQVGAHPVVPSFVLVTFFQRDDALVLSRVDAEVIPNPADILSQPPLLDAEAALDQVQSYFPEHRIAGIQGFGMEVEPLLQNGQVSGRWVYRYRIDAVSPVAHYEVTLDARTGELGRCYDTICYCDLQGHVCGLASPGLLPDNPANPPSVTALPGIEVTVPGVGTAITDANGEFCLPSAGTDPQSVEVRLEGPYVRVLHGTGPEAEVSLSLTPGTPESIVFNDPASPEVTAQVNGFLHVNRAHEFIKSIDPNFEGVDYQMLCFVNQPQNCNANYNNGTISFATEGNGCVNAAYSSIIYHEYGHAVVDGIFPIAQPGAYNEGVSDTCAVLLADDPRVGAEWTTGNALRDVDTQDRSYPLDVGNEIHDAGLIVAGSFWDTYQALIPVLGAGPALEKAREYFLFHIYFLTGEISPLLTIDVLLVDDDDGNVLNGTPHRDAIDAGFGAHGLPAPDLDVIDWQHDVEPDTLNSVFPYRIEVQAEGLLQDVANVTVFYSTDGVNYTALTAAPLGANRYAADIPPQPSPNRVHYYFHGVDTDGNEETWPAVETDGPFGFFVGRVETLFLEEVGDTAAGWTHDAAGGGDDWQRGLPNAQGDNPWDPIQAASPPFAWGNDLNPLGWDGFYAAGTMNWLDSPLIPIGNPSQLWLQYARWLTLDRFDLAAVEANGVSVFESSADRDTLDRAWKLMTHDLTSAVVGATDLQLRFSLTSNSVVQYGGWTLDDFRVLSVEGVMPASQRLSIPTATVPAGAHFKLPIQVESTVSVFAVSLQFQYDPQQVFVAGVRPGGLIEENLTPILNTALIDAESGLVNVELSLGSGADELPPSVGIAVIELDCFAAGTLPDGALLSVSLVQGSLLDSLGAELAPVLDSGAIEVVGATGPVFTRGDVNSDCVVDLSDPVAGVIALFDEGAPLPCADALDINDSGACELADVVQLLHYLFFESPTPVSPFVLPGVDESDDALDCANPCP